MSLTIARTQEISNLYDAVLTRENLLLLAPSGMGKTNLCKELIEKLEGRRICYYFSARGYVSLADFVQNFIQVLRENSVRFPNVDYNLRRFFQENINPDFSTSASTHQYLADLTTCLEQMAKDFLVVVEDIDEWEGEEDLASLIAVLSQSKNSQILLSSGKDIALNIALQPHRISPLNPSHIRPFLENEDTAVQLLLFTKGHTGFTLEMLNKKVALQHSLAAATKEFMNQVHGAFSTFQKRFTSLQWRLLKAIADEDIVAQPHSFDFLMKHRLGAASSVERALKNLSETDLIYKNEAGWQIRNVIFQRWLQWLYAA